MKGSCHCGTVVYEVARLAGPISHCHCVTCRKTHAAAYVAFCSVCGCHIVASRESQPHVILRIATLDDDPGTRPTMHIWRSHDVPWLVDDETLASFAEWPPGR